jgi:threonine 3-dehydrogenase
MKAIRKLAPVRGCAVVDVETPVPGPGEVLIRVSMRGICGTDLHIFQWDAWSQGRIRPPVTYGHEFVGTIEAIGPGVDRFRLGQRVSAEGHITCGTCRHCRNGEGHLCRDVRIIGVDRDGCFAEHLVMPAGNLWAVRDAIPDRHAALFDPIGNAMHTVMSQPVNMKKVLVTGAGAIGLFAVPIAWENGAESIVVVEPSPMKRELALKMGAQHAFDSADPDLAARILEATGGFSPDVLLEMSGAASALRLGLRLIANGGHASLLGIPHGETTLDLANEVIFKGVTLHGVTGRRMYETWYQVEDFLLRHGASIEPAISGALPLERVQDGFAGMEDGTMVKVLLGA